MNVTQRSENPTPLSKAKVRLDPRQQSFTIGDLAREFSVSLRTLRFYEDRGLLSPHREGSARLYQESDKSRLAIILNLKSLDFSLSEIKEMLRQNKNAASTHDIAMSPETISGQIAHLERRKQEIDKAIDELRSQFRELRQDRTAP